MKIASCWKCSYMGEDFVNNSLICMKLFRRDVQTPDVMPKWCPIKGVYGEQMEGN